MKYRYDPIEETVFDDLANVADELEEVSELLAPVLDFLAAIRQDLSSLASDPGSVTYSLDRLQDAVYYHDDMAWIGHFRLGCIRLRRRALTEGDFTWYVAATYGLVQSWVDVAESVPWLDWWGIEFVDRPQLQLLTVWVWGMVEIDREHFERGARIMAQENYEDVVDLALSYGVMKWKQDRAVPGDKRPSLG